MANAASIAHRLGGRRRGPCWDSECPVCGYPLSLWDGEDGFPAFTCFGPCEYDQIAAALVPFGLLDFNDAEYGVTPPVVTRTSYDDARRIQAACRTYDCLPTPGPFTEDYLHSRHISITSSVLRSGLCRHRNGGAFPAMVAPVVNIDGGQTAYHATFLRSDGSGKADFTAKSFQRECRGVIRNGTIRLAPYDPGSDLIIAEGLENALSAMELFSLPGWSAVSAGGLATVELPAMVRRIVIACDNDTNGAGQRAALAAYERWRNERRVVRIAMPPSGGDDFNDVLRRKHHGR